MEQAFMGETKQKSNASDYADILKELWSDVRLMKMSNLNSEQSVAVAQALFYAKEFKLPELREFILELVRMRVSDKALGIDSTVKILRASMQQEELSEDDRSLKDRLLGRR